GIAVVKVPALPAATLAERLAHAVDDRTAAVLVSAVLYENAHIVPDLARVLAACRRAGVELLIDAYQALGVRPFSLRKDLLADRFDALDADPRLIKRDHAVPLPELGGFLALESPRAEELRRGLRDRGVAVDHRAHVLRLGPAPYLSDAQLGAAVDALESVV